MLNDIKKQKLLSKMKTKKQLSEMDKGNKGKQIQGGPQKCPYFSLTITFTKIRKPSRFFLHRYWKFIEFFWWKPL